MNQLENDVILPREVDHPDLLETQKSCLDPIICWVNTELHTEIRPSEELLLNHVSDGDKAKLESYLSKFSFESLVGLKFATDSVKSVMLTMAAFGQHLDCEAAVSLSNLEEQFQISKWGNIEWAHDVTRLETLSRFTAAILFAIYSSEVYFKSHQFQH